MRRFVPALCMLCGGELMSVYVGFVVLCMLTAPKWVHCLFLFALVLGKMQLSHVTLCLFCAVKIIFSLVLKLLSIKFQNGAHLKKGLFLTYPSQFLVTREKAQKFIQHISHLHIYTYFAHHIDFLFYFILFYFIYLFVCCCCCCCCFFAFPILQKLRIYRVRFIFGVTPGVDSFPRHFGVINN